MATTYNHIRMSEVDSSGNIRVMYPETTGADVTISRTNNSNIPSTVSTAQGLADKLVASAFTNPISDSTTTTSSTWSSNKINTAVTNISVYVSSSDGKIHFTNSAGTDTALNFSSASGTATAAQVLTGYTFSNSSGKGLNGSMANQGAWTSPSPAGTGNTCNASTTKDITIPAGYHNGSGYVRIASLSSQTSATAAAGDIISGKTAWVNGSKLTGTYTAASITSITPSDSNPVSLTANNNYKPTSLGYAIYSYSTVTPSNGSSSAAPPTIASGGIYKMGGTGKAVASVTDIIPTNGNSSTAIPSVTAYSVYRPTKAGKLAESISDIEPSNQTPVSVTGYSVYRPTKAGKVVYSITDTAGSVSGTSYSQNTILKTTATVYVYSSKPTHTGTYNLGGTDIVFPDDFGATKDMGTEHSFRYVKIPDKPAINLSAFTEEYSLLTTHQSSKRTETHTYTATKNGTNVLVCVGIGANALDAPTITTTGTMISDSRKLKTSNGGGVGVALAILNSGESITATATFSSYGIIYMKFWVQ